MLVCVIEMKQRQLPSLFELGNKSCNLEKRFKILSMVKQTFFIQIVRRVFKVPGNTFKTVEKCC